MFGLTGSARRQMERAMREESLKFGETLREIPSDDWPATQRKNPNRPLRALRSRDFLVQVYNEGHHGVLVRLSINRARLNAAGTRWEDGITWDDLQRLKAEAGYADFDAVEVYPQQAEVVNVANVRHLWIMAEPLPFKWGRDGDTRPSGVMDPDLRHANPIGLTPPQKELQQRQWLAHQQKNTDGVREVKP